MLPPPGKVTVVAPDGKAKRLAGGDVERLVSWK
jgi:hypothetical protein